MMLYCLLFQTAPCFFCSLFFYHAEGTGIPPCSLREVKSFGVDDDQVSEQLPLDGRCRDLGEEFVDHVGALLYREFDSLTSPSFALILALIARFLGANQARPEFARFAAIAPLIATSAACS